MGDAEIESFRQTNYHEFKYFDVKYRVKAYYRTYFKDFKIKTSRRNIAIINKHNLEDCVTIGPDYISVNCRKLIMDRHLWIYTVGRKTTIEVSEIEELAIYERTETVIKTKIY